MRKSMALILALLLLTALGACASPHANAAGTEPPKGPAAGEAPGEAPEKPENMGKPEDMGKPGDMEKPGNTEKPENMEKPEAQMLFERTAARIDEMEGSLVTLTLGQLSPTGTEGGQPGEGAEMSMDEKARPEGGVMPGEQGEKPAGEDKEPPEGMTEPSQGETPPDNSMSRPEGEGHGMEMPFMFSFTAGEESVSYDLDGLPISIRSAGQLRDGSLEELEIGDILLLETDEEEELVSVTVLRMSGTESGTEEE